MGPIHYGTIRTFWLQHIKHAEVEPRAAFDRPKNDQTYSVGFGEHQEKIKGFCWREKSGANDEQENFAADRAQCPPTTNQHKVANRNPHCCNSSQKHQTQRQAPAKIIMRQDLPNPWRQANSQRVRHAAAVNQQKRLLVQLQGRLSLREVNRFPSCSFAPLKKQAKFPQNFGSQAR